MVAIEKSSSPINSKYLLISLYKYTCKYVSKEKLFSLITHKTVITSSIPIVKTPKECPRWGVVFAHLKFQFSTFDWRSVWILINCNHIFILDYLRDTNLMNLHFNMIFRNGYRSKLWDQVVMENVHLDNSFFLIYMK